MNNAENNSNNIISRLKEGFQRVLSVITYSIEDPADEFDKITANSKEDEKILNELKKSSKKLDAYAKQYTDSIGVPSKPKKQIQSRKTNVVSTDNSIKRDTVANGKTSKIQGFDRED